MTIPVAKKLPAVRAVIVIEGLPTVDKNSSTVTIDVADTHTAVLVAQALASYAGALKRLNAPRRPVALRPWWEVEARRIHRGA